MSRFNIAALAIVAMPSLAFAAYDSYPDTGGVYVGPLFETNIGFGGDNYFGVIPGDTLEFSGGLFLRPHRNSMFDMRFAVGIGTAAGDSEDDYIGYTTWKVVPSIRLPLDFRVGVGAELHTNLKYQDEGSNSGPLVNDTGPDRVHLDTTFKSAFGPTFELGWHFHGGRHFDGGITAFATLMQYEPENGPDLRKRNANSYGIRLSAALGWSFFGSSGPTYIAPAASAVPASSSSNPWATSAPAPAAEQSTTPPPPPPAPAYTPGPTYRAPASMDSGANVGGTKHGARVAPEAPPAPPAPVEPAPVPPAPIAPPPAPRVPAAPPAPKAAASHPAKKAAAPAKPAPPAAPVVADAKAAAQAPLRSRPALESAGKQILGVGAPLRLVTQLQNDGGTWWYVETESGAQGWLRDSEIQR